MFTIASAANRTRPEITVAHSADPIIAAQADAVDAMSGAADDEATLDALKQLRDTDPNNAVYSYLIAAHHARRNEWDPAYAALQQGNEAPAFSLATAAAGKGGYPALTVLRQLIIDCTKEGIRRGDDATTDGLLMGCGTLANRLAHEAKPCDLPILESAGEAYQMVERARLTVWEREGRDADAGNARLRLAARARWWHVVVAKSDKIDASDPTVREAVAQQMRARLPL